MVLGGWCIALILRNRWTNFPRRRKVLAIAFSLLLIFVYVTMRATAWRFTSTVMDEAMPAAAVASYTFLALLLSLVRPKWLTGSFAGLLLLPAAVAVLWLPLLAWRDSGNQTEHVAGTIFIEKHHWDKGALGSSGTTLWIYNRPRVFPAVEHVQKVTFDDAGCNSEQAFVVLQSGGDQALARCYMYENDDGPVYHDVLVPLR